MIRYILLFLLLFGFGGCVGKRGISMKYYNDCREYYDLQGYYHKECDDSGMMTYKKMGEYKDDAMERVGLKEKPKPKPKGNVW